MGLLAFVPLKDKQTVRPQSYSVHRLKSPMSIDGNWNKPAWRKARTVNITRFMGPIPPFRPRVQAKMLYDERNLYVIFRVEDRYVRSLVDTYNGPVSGDACVEFFFSPDPAHPERYFNLEVNAGGTPLMAYHIYPQKDYQRLTSGDLDQIEIAHSLPKKIDPEIAEDVTWTIEYRIPIEVLEKYGSVVRPEKGKRWRANFYKTASKSSNPHWITWSQVQYEKPNFHLPQFFGGLRFR